MKFPTIFAVLALSTMTALAQETPAAPAAPAKALSPKQQITGFYALCKDNRAAEGLQEMLASNPVVQGNDVTRVAQAFGQLVSQMGPFVDFEFDKETRQMTLMEIAENTTLEEVKAHTEADYVVSPSLKTF